MPAGPRLKQLKQPLAIAMWDFSWLLRHHRLGAFADWDKTLDALVLRGYDAIRIDCFPHLVSADNDGVVTQEYYHPKNAFGLTLWGNEFSVSTRPREALLEFLPKCQERGVWVGLSTWFNDHNTGRAGTVCRRGQSRPGSGMKRWNSWMVTACFGMLFMWMC